MADKPQKATLLQVIRMVLSAFLGVRQRREHDRIEVAPVQVIIVGVIAAAIFVITVVSVVRLVIR
ncbi:MAG: hypothetical protein H6R21_837 [Proteobacteria bacterium]|nr:hypothetical protein [Pseudomonadota bacterium]RPJ48643.1 MAG: DUF2970 domain-containing protein [Betaproteobacteria bacterium]